MGAMEGFRFMISPLACRASCIALLSLHGKVSQQWFPREILGALARLVWSSSRYNTVWHDEALREFRDIK
jgi:hypothetical protein